MYGYTQPYVGYAMYKEGNVGTKSAVMSCWYAQIYSSCLLSSINFHFSVFFFFKYFVSSSISNLFEANFKNPLVKQFLFYIFSNYFYIDVSP